MEEFKLSVQRPQKTGLELLNEMFELAAGHKKSARVVVLYNYMHCPHLDFWRIGRDGIAAGFISVPVHNLAAIKTKMSPVGDDLAGLDERKFLLTREECGERVADSLDPRLLVGDFNQRIENGQAIGEDKILVMQWGLRTHPFIDLCFDGFFTIDSNFLKGYILAIDLQLTFGLGVNQLGAETKYLFTSSLTELTFPLGRGWRARDHSFDLDTVFHSYKTLNCELEPTGLMRELWAAGRVNNALQKEQELFDELFTYWRELNRELDRLNQEYINKRNGGRYCG
ncbi:MAG: hypothetical protein HY813_03900 [Candidatus Portnoybacteria bacterium]|nr:hypothetical protein [Candidatus Portnoybacteria bacterium]